MMVMMTMVTVAMIMVMIMIVVMAVVMMMVMMASVHTELSAPSYRRYFSRDYSHTTSWPKGCW